MTGLPAALEQTCMYVSILLLQIIVSSFDIGTGQTVHLSGYGVGNRIIDFLKVQTDIQKGGNYQKVQRRFAVAHAAEYA